MQIIKLMKLIFIKNYFNLLISEEIYLEEAVNLNNN